MRPTSRWVLLAVVFLGLGVGSCYQGFDGLEGPAGGVLAADLEGQASLEVEATVTEMRAERRTDWSLECQSDPGRVENPSGAGIQFLDLVTEGPTRTVLTVKGGICITNNGSGPAPVESVIVNLQTKDKGPFGTVTSVACGDPSQLCNSQGPEKIYLDNEGSGDLVLLDAAGVDICGDLPTLAVGETVCVDYIATFFLDSFGLEEGDHARIEALVTFSNAGERGGSGASCQNDKEPGDFIRTVASRISGQIPVIEESNQSVEFCKWISSAPDPLVADVPDFTITTDARDNDCDDGVVLLDGTMYCCTILATGDEGTETLFVVASTATCVWAGVNDAETSVENTATLEGSDTQDGISGTPASCVIEIACEGTGGGGGGVDEGDFCTQTQGGYGQTCDDLTKKKPGCLLANNFDAVFPGGLVVGGGFTMTFASAGAVAAYLPAGGTPASLTQDHVNPLTTESGVFGGQVTALAISVAFDAAGVGLNGPSGLGCGGGVLLSELVIQSGPWAGDTVGDLLALAEEVLGGDTSGLGGNSISDLNNAVTSVNECFVDCKATCGFLDCP